MAVGSREPAPSLARAGVSEPAAGGGTRDSRPATRVRRFFSISSASIEKPEAPATLQMKMEAEPRPTYGAEQARLEAVEKMRRWHAERDTALRAAAAHGRHARGGQSPREARQLGHQGQA